MLVFISLALRALHNANLANRKRTPSGKRIKVFGGQIDGKSIMKSFGTLVGKTTSAVIRNDRQIKQVISQIVPASTMAHIQFCRVEGGRLRITLDSAAWVSKIRFSERQISDILRKQHFDAHTISYHVAPAEQPIVRKTERTAQKTPQGAIDVEAIAATLADARDDRLRMELLKLARSLRKQ